MLICRNKLRETFFRNVSLAAETAGDNAQFAVTRFFSVLLHLPVNTIHPRAFSQLLRGHVNLYSVCMRNVCLHY